MKKSCVLCRNFISIYIINRTFHGCLGIRILSCLAESISHEWARRTSERYFQHSKIKIVSPRSHEISSMYCMWGVGVSEFMVITLSKLQISISEKNHTSIYIHEDIHMFYSQVRLVNIFSSLPCLSKLCQAKIFENLWPSLEKFRKYRKLLYNLQTVFRNFISVRPAN